MRKPDQTVFSFPVLHALAPALALLRPLASATGYQQGESSGQGRIVMGKVREKSIRDCGDDHFQRSCPRLKRPIEISIGPCQRMANES